MFRTSTLILVGTILFGQAAWAQRYSRYQQSILSENRFWYNTTKFRGHNKRFWMAAHLTLPAWRDKMVEMVETMLKLHPERWPFPLS